MTLENREQILASDPTHSVWVSASAGTGKTKVLTDRVLRLLLSDVPFEKILCLTFTNAAATEMTNRVSNACLEWQTNTESVGAILGRTPSKEEIFKAKQLFSKLMLSPRQLPSHTIHSFCQKILQSFPFEAGLQPGFKVISEIDASEIIENVVQDLGKEIENFALLQEKVGDSPIIPSPKLNYTRHEERSLFLLGEPTSNDVELILGFGINPLFQHITYLLQNLHENTFLEMIREILGDRIYFQELFKQFSSPLEYEKFLRHKMDALESQEELLDSLHKRLDDKTISFILGKLGHNNGPIQLASILSFFLTAKGELKKKLLAKKESDSLPGFEAKLLQIQEVVYKIDQKIKVLRMISSTISIYSVSEYVINKYNFYKNKKGDLDYDDLIYHTKELLTNSDMRDWVLYKLDGGLNHLLIDEAQDTSPEQWQIIEAIISEFYSGSARSEENRTIFIVGDEKQSIYSFQGADVGNFNRFNDYIRKQMHDASKSYKDAHLIWSYRSSSIILEFIEHMSGLYSIRSHDSILQPFRQSKGCVEIWPLYHDKKAKKELFWPLVEDMQAEEEAHILLARDIAKYVSNYIESGIVLESTGKPASAEDFMILVRRRNAFMEEVISALKDYGVGVGGMDRMVLTDHISVQDILSLAKYALIPKDELNMGELLKSPIIGMNDAQLLHILTLLRASKDASLPENFIRENPILTIICNLALATTASEFFYNLIEVLGLRQLLVNANGPSTHDALDELLNLVMQFEKKNSSSLQEFIYWIERKEIEIKRDPNSSGTVRVMTIHGSKGLESPVVILGDTTSLPARQNHLLWEGGVCLWLGGSPNANEMHSNIKKSAELLDYQEYLRLLYVALTRAEDHLIIAGSTMRENIPEGCFYNVADKVISGMKHEEAEGYKWIGERSPIRGESVAGQGSAETGSTSEDIASACYKSEIYCLKVLGDKGVAFKNGIDNIDVAQSPLDSRMSLNYGQLIHKILEDSVNTRNFEFSPSHPMIKPLSDQVQKIIVDKITKLFSMEEFRTLIQDTNIKTEVPIGYNDGEMVKIGRIDLLSISDNKIIIIDYKTDKRVPESSIGIPEGYIQQLKFYADALQRIYPDYQIYTKILWIENLILMDVVQHEGDLYR